MSKDTLDIVAEVVETGRALAAKATADFLAQYGDRDCCGLPGSLSTKKARPRWAVHC